MTFFSSRFVHSGLMAVMILLPGSGLAREDPDLRGQQAGQLFAMEGSKKVELPMLKTTYDIAIDGPFATVSVTQGFFNPGTVPVDATYLFPLVQKAAVYRMTMAVGDETIEAVMKKKEEAKATFETAKADGKAAALLEQHRPNMFTQNIANLMPGEQVLITLNYVQKVPRIDDAYELVVPMVVGPRYEGVLPKTIATAMALDADDDYMPVDHQHEKTAPVQDGSGWLVERLPEYPPVIGLTAPDKIDPRRVELNAALRSATGFLSLASSTHEIETKTDDGGTSFHFAKGREIDNRDFVLRYSMAEEERMATGALTHFDETRGGFLSLHVEPPKLAPEDLVTPRELVFVLDTSGSMGGLPMDASKSFMHAALDGLRESDQFRILRFASNTSAFAQSAVHATKANIKAGKNFVTGLSAGGGTEMNNAINAAFDLPSVPGTMRIVVFLTDGYIGGDREVIQTVSDRIGNARIHAFGVGKAINRYLLEGLAREGRGRVRYIEPGETGQEAAAALASSIDAPLLTDIEIDWNGLDVSDQTPARLPDLFAGNAIDVMARYKGEGPHQITVKGFVNGRRAEIPVSLSLNAAKSESEQKADSPLPLIWAREQIFEKERALTLSGGTDTKTKAEIIRLGLDYSLQSAFTSFVAVSQKVQNPDPSANAKTSVPLPKVSGISNAAYPNLNLSGSSTPEPEGLAALLGALLMLMARYRTRLQRWIKRQCSATEDGKTTRPFNVPDRVAKDGWWLETPRR